MTNNYAHGIRNGETSATMEQVDRKRMKIAQEDAQGPRKSTGFLGIDKLTTGLADGDLVVIASRPAMGKTALVIDIANHLIKEMAKTTAFFL